VSEEKKRPISRRDFARRTALAASAACLPALLPDAVVEAQDALLSAAGQAEVDVTVATIIRKFGDRMTDAQKLDVRRVVTGNQKGLDAMRIFAPDNADQPGNVLKIYPDAPAGPASSTQRETPQNKK
jgi:hypothetical protein